MDDDHASLASSRSSSFSSLPSISSRAHRSRKHKQRLKERKREILSQATRIEQLLAVDEVAAEASRPPLPQLRVGYRGQPFCPLPALPPVDEQPRESPGRVDVWGDGGPRPYRHYLFANMARAPPAESMQLWGGGSAPFNPMRKVTPLRWGYPGVLSDTTPAARAHAQARADAEHRLGHRLPALAESSLLTLPGHPALNPPPGF